MESCIFYLFMALKIHPYALWKQLFGFLKEKKVYYNSLESVLKYYLYVNSDDLKWFQVTHKTLCKLEKY